jgi:Ca-activated chloride channel family protein
MRSRIALFVVAGWMASGWAAGQTSDQDLPSAPSATVEQNAPAKQAPPPAQSAPTPKPHEDNELKPGDNTQQASQPPAESDHEKAQPAPSPTGSSSDGKTSGTATSANTAPGTTSQPASTSPQAPGTPTLETPPGLQDQEGTEARDPAAIIKTFVNEVRVIFTVTDKHGRYIKDLKKADFRVIDDNKPAERIRSFHAETDLPLQVGLLVDASNSVRDRFKFEQEAAIEFLNSIIRPRYDVAMTVGFDSTPDVTQDFTDNTELLSRGVRALRAGGGTAMYDAVYFACRDKLMKQPQTGPVRRAIILLSDGDDNSSHVTREEAIEMAQRAEVIVYTISTNVTGSKGKGDKVLERIAEATGGRAFFPFQIRDVTDAFASIQDELRSQYAMTYTPSDLVADGRFRTIEILAQEKGFKVRTRKGYYAPRR